MTHNHNFRLNEREVVKVSMMQTKGNFLAANDQELDCDVLQLEYVGGISMLTVVPHKLSGMKTLEAQLTPQVVERWQKSMTNRYFGLSVRSFDLQEARGAWEYLNLGHFKKKGAICIKIHKLPYWATLLIQRKLLAQGGAIRASVRSTLAPHVALSGVRDRGHKPAYQRSCHCPTLCGSVTCKSTMIVGPARGTERRNQKPDTSTLPGPSVRGVQQR